MLGSSVGSSSVGAPASRFPLPRVLVSGRGAGGSSLAQAAIDEHAATITAAEDAPARNGAIRRQNPVRESDDPVGRW